MVLVDVGVRVGGDETDGGRGDGIDVDDPVPAEGVVGVDFFVKGAVLFVDEDGVADGEGVVEGVGDGGRGVGGGLGRGGRADGEDGGAGGWEEGDCVGGFRGGHFWWCWLGLCLKGGGGRLQGASVWV